MAGKVQPLFEFLERSFQYPILKRYLIQAAVLSTNAFVGIRSLIKVNNLWPKLEREVQHGCSVRWVQQLLPLSFFLWKNTTPGFWHGYSEWCFSVIWWSLTLESDDGLMTSKCGGFSANDPPTPQKILGKVIGSHSQLELTIAQRWMRVRSVLVCEMCLSVSGDRGSDRTSSDSSLVASDVGNLS